jgi:hypothetical protein
MKRYYAKGGVDENPDGTFVRYEDAVKNEWLDEQWRLGFSAGREQGAAETRHAIPIAVQREREAIIADLSKLWDEMGWKGRFREACIVIRSRGPDSRGEGKLCECWKHERQVCDICQGVKKPGKIARLEHSNRFFNDGSG